MAKAKLTDKLIASLRTDRPQEDYFDTRTPHAGIRLTQDGRKRFFMFYRSPVVRDAKGQPKLRRLLLGEHPSGKPGSGIYMNVDQFRESYEILRGDLRRGIDPKEATANGNGIGNGYGTANGNGTANGYGSTDSTVPVISTLPGPLAGVVLTRRKASGPVALVSVPEWLADVFAAEKGVAAEIKVGTFGAALLEWFDAAKEGRGCKRLAGRTLENYVSAAKTHLQGLARLPLSDITTEMIEDLYRSIGTKSPQMVRQVRKLIGGAFEHARGHIAGYRSLVNPAKGIRIAIPKGKRKVWLTEEQITALYFGLGALAAKPNKDLAMAADVYQLILASGCRPGEAAGINASEIITVNGERVWKFNAKGGSEHMVPVVGLIAEIVDRRLAAVGGKGPLFWNRVNRDAGYPWQLRRSNKMIRALTGLSFNPHDLRRTLRTHIESMGISHAVGEAVLGHKKEDLIGTYSLYTYWKERKEALVVWHEKLRTLMV